MRILFITMLDIRSIEQHDIYTDLMREFVRHGHDVTIVSPVEKRAANKASSATLLREGECVQILKVKSGNIQKVGWIEKGISTVLLPHRILKAMNNNFSEFDYDLILYSTPPITLYGVIKRVKKKSSAKTYLLLKDIFPQNSVDLGILTKKGLKGILYSYFRKIEKKLYRISDRIGCMSQANVDYLLKHNPEITAEKVEICPNCIEYVDTSLTDEQKIEVRNQYGIPNDKKVFVYGGNLGKPQGIPFLIDSLRAEQTNSEAFFLIVGDGTEYGRLDEYVRIEKPTNVRLLRRLPREEYDRLIAACDVGMIFLDHRFTIPNFPSRLLSYMQAGLPVLACTDPNTDIGKVIIEGSFGWWCESDDVKKFSECVNAVCRDSLAEKGEIGFLFLKENYSVEKEYKIITGMLT